MVTEPGKHLALHSSIANVNPGQMLRVWRNATDGFVYVSLPGGLLPGPYRVLQRGKRHVVDDAPVCVPFMKLLCLLSTTGWWRGSTGLCHWRD